MNDYEEDLLDSFAVVALAELLRDDLPKSVATQMGYKWACEYAYIIADSMMEARRAYYATKTT